MTNVIPRRLDNTSVVQVKMKHVLSHKTDYIIETVNPAKVIQALKSSKKKTLYKEIQLTSRYEAFKKLDLNESFTQMNFVVDKKDEIVEYEDFQLPL